MDYQSNSEVGSLGIEKPPDLGFALSFNETDKVRREGSCYLAVISLVASIGGHSRADCRILGDGVSSQWILGL